MKRLALTYYSINLIIAVMLFSLLPFINDNGFFLFDLLAASSVLIYSLFGLISSMFIPKRFQLEENYLILKEANYALINEELQNESPENSSGMPETEHRPVERLNIPLKIYR